MIKAFVRNCTRHVVRVRLADGTDREYPPSGELAVVESILIDGIGGIEGVPTFRRSYGPVTIPVPGFQPGFDGGEVVRNFLIVSTMVLDAARLQHHSSLDCLLVPDSGPDAIRDENGQVYAVRRFIVA